MKYKKGENIYLDAESAVEVVCGEVSCGDCPLSKCVPFNEDWLAEVGPVYRREVPSL